MSLGAVAVRSAVRINGTVEDVGAATLRAVETHQR